MIINFKKNKWTGTILAVILTSFIGIIGLTGCSLSTNLSFNNNTATLPDSTTSGTVNKDTSSGSAANTAVSTGSTNDSSGTSTNSSSTSAGTSGPSGSATASPVPANSDEAFLGQWVINKALAFGSAGTYSSEEANSLQGKSLSFYKDKASGFGDQPSYIIKVITNPEYKKSVISKNDFVTNYRMTFEKLGIKTDSIPQVTVSDSNGNGYTFLIKDNNTLIIIGGGTYFELLRKTK